MSFDLDEFGFDEKKWEDVSEEEGTEKKIVQKEWSVDSPERNAYGYNVALPAYEWKGKSLLGTLIGFLNTEYFSMFDVQENYPNVYRLIKEGYIPEVEALQVLDLDASYENLSHSGIFFELVKPLYSAGKILRKTIKVPQRQQKLLNNTIREIAMFDIDKTKIEIENEITIAVRDNGPEIALLIDSMSSYDELLNNKFRIIYENVIAEEDKRSLGSSLKGIKQSFWTIRNGWWLETLRDKRSYKGWQLDTYKIEDKPDIWLEKEIKMAKDKGKRVEDIVPFKIQWAPRTEFELDFIMQINNDGESYWVDVKNRFQGNADGQKDRCYYTPEKRRAWYEILEKLAPYLMSEKEEEELW